MLSQYQHAAGITHHIKILSETLPVLTPSTYAHSSIYFVNTTLNLN